MKKQVIEYGGEPVGIVIPDEGMLRFIAVKFHVHDLDNHRFATPTDVVRAIGNMLRDRRSSATASQLCAAC